MAVFFCILEESMALGDRILVFSQSLFTLNLIEDFLQRTNLPGRQEKWARNWNYYRKLKFYVAKLDGIVIIWKLLSHLFMVLMAWNLSPFFSSKPYFSSLLMCTNTYLPFKD